MADDKIEEIIKEIAAKHGIAVGRDDPILILQTINEKLMRDSAVAQQAIKYVQGRTGRHRTPLGG